MESTEQTSHTFGVPLTLKQRHCQYLGDVGGGPTSFSSHSTTSLQVGLANRLVAMPG